ncbi:MAG: WhiB family transcriptional regulator [Ilumatobacter sp.]|nr:WhiB family transcriptional regulator [Ilumatobacter sp.]
MDTGIRDVHGPLDWRVDAACQGEVGVIFFPPMRSEKRTAKAARERRAKDVCTSCPVRSDCLDEAMANGERHGIWGGLTDQERARLAAT